MQTREQQATIHCAAEGGERPLRSIAKQDGHRLDARLQVIHAILVGIDAVVDKRPENASSIERQEVVERERVGDGSPAHEDAPIESQAEHELRPVGQSLHERIDDHKRHGEESCLDRGEVESGEDGQPCGELQAEEG
eukprot:scaffold2320_cov168-Ochromonas_danica.AAC.7